MKYNKEYKTAVKSEGRKKVPQQLIQQESVLKTWLTRPLQRPLATQTWSTRTPTESPDHPDLFHQTPHRDPYLHYKAPSREEEGVEPKEKEGRERREHTERRETESVEDRDRI